MLPLPSVPVQHLNPRHREDIVRHLLRLQDEDRRLRFGRHMRDDMLREYVEGIDFERDRVFGVQDADLNLIGFAHLAVDPATRVAELGVSVDPVARGKGYGFALLERVVLHASNHGYRVLFMYCLAENGIMMHLARKAGLTVVVEAGEADARLALDRVSAGGVLREAMADQFALVDCMLKQQYLWLAGQRATCGAPQAARLAPGCGPGVSAECS